MRWAWIAAAAAALVASVVFAPSAILNLGLKAAGVPLSLVQTQGYWWSGSGVMALKPPRDAGSIALPGRLSWSLEGVTAFAPRLVVRAECCAAEPLVFHLKGKGWVALDAARLTIPLHWLQALGAPWNTLAIQGDARIHVQEAAIGWQGSGLQSRWRMEIDLLNVSSSLAPLPSIGNYKLLTSLQNGNEVKLSLSTTSGSLRISATLQQSKGRYALVGEAVALENLESLSNLLNLIGKRSGNEAKIFVSF